MPFIDARELPGGSEIVADLIVIGGGLAGLTLAREWAGTGRSVAVIESGGKTFDPAVQDLYRGEGVQRGPGNAEKPFDAYVHESRRRMLGGSGNVWGAEHDRIWAMLAERRLPFILHVGSAPLSIEAPWMNDGRPDRRSARGGAEVIGSKDLTVIHHAAVRFISTLILDGVLERHPTLKGGVIELGAGWVPDMIRRLDHAAEIWAKSEPHLAEMSRRPSDQIRAQLRFTPYPFEDVAAFVRESSPDLYLFSSDYPHAEGGRDPIGRFERSLEGADDGVKRRFYADNFASLYPEAVAGLTAPLRPS